MMTVVRWISYAAAVAALFPTAARATTTSCNIPQPCAVFANNNGSAIEGESAAGDGVLGEASSGTIYGAGIEGESLKQTGADAAGTFGLTLLTSGVAPNYGVVAYGSLYGVYGQAGNTGLSQTGPGYGVFGQDNAGSNTADYNAGVTGRSTNGVGVLAEGSGTPTASFYGGEGVPIGLYAVAKDANANSYHQSAAIVAESDSYTQNVENSTKGFSLDLADPEYFIDDIKLSAGNLGYNFYISYAGAEYLGGGLAVSGGVTSVHGGPYMRTTGASGRTVTAYSDHTTTPEMEDFGEAQLVDGKAFVPIDAAFTDVVDLRGGYHVVVTPEGEGNGLYVVKGSGGFIVREEQDGRSSLPFFYRIAARPREERGARLAGVTEVAPHVEDVAGSRAWGSPRLPLPLSPEERLKRKNVRPATATTSCNVPQPCAVFANNGGTAFEGESAGADGVLGEASSGTIYGAGVEGESLNQTGADAAGAFGLTLLSNGVAPNYGVVAYGSLYGVYGQAGNTGLSKTGPGYGVFGQDNAGSNKADYNVGVTGLSKNNVGVLAEGSGSPAKGLYGEGLPIGLYAVAASTNGNSLTESRAILAESDTFGEVVENTTEGYSFNMMSPNYVVEGFPTGQGTNYGVFSVDYSGNGKLNGYLKATGGATSVHGGPYLQTTGASGRTVTAYSDHTTTPEMEDVGEAHLVNGRAFVPIDAALADVIDLRGGYHVFVTPEGESNGLYVVKGAGGFFVREQQGGRATLAFEYRIVAKPREEIGTRLAPVTDVASPTRYLRGAGRGQTSQQIPLPLSPEELLKRKIGPRAYAELMTTLAKRFASLHSL